MLTIAIIILLIFFGGGIFGWILNIVGHIIAFLWEGCTHVIGCLFWIFAIIVCFYALIS